MRVTRKQALIGAAAVVALAGASVLYGGIIGSASVDVPTAACSSPVYDGSNLTIQCTIPQTTTTVTSTVTSTVTATPTSAPSSAPPVSSVPPSSPPVATPTAGPTTFPDSTNTGVPAGTALTAYTGSCNLPAGTVLDAKIINCSVLRIMGAGVQITRSQITGIVSSDHSNAGQKTSSVSISDSFIDGGNQETFPTVSYDSVTLSRVEIVRGQYAVQCNSNCTVTDSYLHGQYEGPNSNGHFNAFLSNGGSNFTLRHNTVWCSVPQTSNDGGCSGDVSFFGDFAPIKNVIVDSNLFHTTGGSYCLFAGNEPSKPYKPSNVSITNNVFQRGGHSGNCGYYGAVTSLGSSAQGYVFSGNKYDDGSPVN